MMFREVTTVLNDRRHLKMVIRSVPDAVSLILGRTEWMGLAALHRAQQVDHARQIPWRVAPTMPNRSHDEFCKAWQCPVFSSNQMQLAMEGLCRVDQDHHDGDSWVFRASCFKNEHPISRSWADASAGVLYWRMCWSEPLKLPHVIYLCCKEVNQSFNCRKDASLSSWILISHCACINRFFQQRGRQISWCSLWFYLIFFAYACAWIDFSKSFMTGSCDIR